MIKLNRSPRTYFDSGCHEYKTYPIEKKLLDLGYAIWNGYDIMKAIREILESHPYISEFDIQRSIWSLLCKIHNIDTAKILTFDRNNSLETDVQILTEDLMRIFRLPQGDRKMAYLGEDPRKISFYELDDMNGWKEALANNSQAYSMYSNGNWIMFPGDGEIIRRFNLEKATPQRAYPSYVYPEPWYGAPTHAKLIVLGNEARYDDFVSRIQNIFLRWHPQIAEEVQLRVDNWLNLRRADFYEPLYQNDKDDLYASMDAYNSPTYRHWLTEFREMAELLDIDTEYDFYEKVAVINANPYPSVGAEPLAAGILPSHYFLRQLIRFIINNNRQVKFILPSESLRHTWRIILGDVYTDLVAFGHLIVLDRGKSICLAKKLTKSKIKELRHLLSK